MENAEKKKILSAFVWKFLERISSQGVAFVIGIVLARMLLPSDYGLVALIQVFVTIANVFVTSGFSAALIQNKDADELDFSTILYCSLIVSILLYAIIFILAPFISDFYNIPELTPVTRVYAVVLVLYGYNSVQSAWVSRNMVFKKFFFATLSGTIVSGVVGLTMAYYGMGVWSIVAHALTNVLVNMLVIRMMISWRPRLIFSFARAKKLMNFGSKILGADLIGTIFNEVQQILIGKIYSPADLALFNRGKSIPYLVTSNIDTSISAVLFPAMSNHSDDFAVIKQMTRKGIKVSSYMMFFFMTTLAISAQSFVELLLTTKWIECVPYLQLVCIASMIGTVSSANMQAIKASGNGGTLLKLEIYKKPVYLALIAGAVCVSVKAVALTFPIYAIYAAIVNMYPNKRILGYTFMEQIRDVAPASLLSCGITVISYPINFLEISAFLKLTFICVVCATSYIMFSCLFRVEAFESCRNIFKNRLRFS